MSVSWNWITTRVATGGALSSAQDAEELAKAGVTHVVDVTDAGDDTPLFVALPGVHVLFNPTADDGSPKPATWFETSLNFALPALAQPHTKVYAHCSAGSNRGPSTAYAILRAGGGWAAVSTLALVKEKRSGASVRYAGDADSALEALGYD